jgi:hypothetical protein
LNEESINAAAAYKTANAIDMTDSPTASTVASVNRSGSIASSRDDKAVPSPVVDGDKHDDDEIVDANGIRQISRFKVFRRIKMYFFLSFVLSLNTILTSLFFHYYHSKAGDMCVCSVLCDADIVSGHPDADTVGLDSAIMARYVVSFSSNCIIHG